MSEKNLVELDILILGGGPAGYAAGIYGARGNVKTGIVDITMAGGQPSNYLELENYPGYPLIGGFELMEKFDEQAVKFGVEKYEMVEIQNINLNSTPKVVETLDTVFQAKTVIIATGAQPQKLGVNGEKEYIGRGVSYCAVCDGAFYKGKTVAVVGGGNAAVEEAAYLTKFVDKVYVIHRRDALRADKIVQERAFKNKKLEFVWDTVVKEINGDEKVTSVTVENVKTKEISDIAIDGIFPYIGFTPNVESYAGQIEQDNRGFIITDANMKTSVEGVYAAGDVRVSPLKQVITAASDGAIAANSAVKYLEMVETEVLAK